MHWQSTFDPFTAHLRLKEMHPLNLGSVSVKYNRCYYTMFDGEHATVEEFVPGPLLSM